MEPRASGPEDPAADPFNQVELEPIDAPELAVPPEAAAAAGDPASAPAAQEPMQLAATWEFVGWEGDAAAPKQAPPWTSIDSEASLELAREPSRRAAPEPEPEPADTLPQLSFDEAVGAIAKATRYDEIGTTLFHFCRSRFGRVLLMTVRYGTAMVVRGRGPGTRDTAMAALRIDLEQPSIFQSAASLRTPVVISSPTSPQEVEFFATFADPPVEAVVLPVLRGEELMDLLYADCGSNPLPPSTMDELTRLAEAAAEAHTRSGENPG